MIPLVKEFSGSLSTCLSLMPGTYRELAPSSCPLHMQVYAHIYKCDFFFK